ncbi:polygalacturonase PglB [Rhizobium sp. SL86]|uniref:polygalacturonase PglB n=1 Tax=Rhizobium sp. SL86 TaxID=2995148 RepID=UPI00227412BB|nr:glycoside hydrolase family 28 protein [Rhizobium sp. SL86]MCY1666962.1 glycoside hydrolase family 28 protein [Rhizobium sp. SL86]
MPKSEKIFIAQDGLHTQSLQQALNETAAQSIRLVLGPGVHLSGALRLPSGTDLHLSDEAVLQFVSDYDAYRDNRVGVIAESSDTAMILAEDASDIRIGGKGLILGPGPDYIVGRLEDMGTHVPAALRPRVLVLKGCQGVRLEDFRIQSSPMWTIHLIACRDVMTERLSIDNDREMPNTDGIVIDSCEGVVIRHCDIATADDGVVLKTSAGPDGSPVGACRNITVEHCEIESRSCALKIGTETHGDVENIRFSDCRLPRSNRGIGLFSRDGGLIRNIEVSRIEVDTHETPDGFWGSGEAITVNVVDRRPGRPAGRIENIVFEDISGAMEGAINLVADSRSGIANLRLTRIGLAQVDGPYRGHTYDVRPTHFDLAPSPDAAGRANAWVKDENGKVIGLVPYPDGMPALFASNIENLSIEDVQFSRPSPLPNGWNAEATVILEGEPVVWSAP